MILIRHYRSPIGDITMAARGDSLSGLWFAGQKYFGSTLTGEEKEGELPVLARTAHWLDLYFGGRVPDFTPALELTASSFRRAVWKQLLKIPYGETVTYGELAERLAKDAGLSAVSPRAVGGAVGHNPISLIIPCHRVLGAGGRLTGYAGGLEKKRFLLALERGEKTEAVLS